jgi:hypothetical protein
MDKLLKMLIGSILPFVALSSTCLPVHLLSANKTPCLHARYIVSAFSLQWFVCNIFSFLDE